MGEFKMNDEDWADISDEAKDLLKKMMFYDPEKRISAVEAMYHPWFDKYIEIKDATKAC